MSFQTFWMCAFYMLKYIIFLKNYIIELYGYISHDYTLAI